MGPTGSAILCSGLGTHHTNIFNLKIILVLHRNIKCEEVPGIWLLSLGA